MKKKGYLLLVPVISLLVSCAGAQKSTGKTDTVKLDPPLKTEKSLLWQISGNGLEQSSYLYGTIHAIPNRDYFMGKNVTKKLKNSSQLIMELDLGNINLQRLQELSLLPDGKTVKDYLSDTDYAAVQVFMEDSIGINKFTFENAYARFKPFYLEQFLYFKELGQERTSYEEEFKSEAEEQNKPVKGLETMEEQLAFIDTIPLELQFESLVDAIKNFSSESKKLRQLIEDYKEQDLPALEKAITMEHKDETAFFTELLLDRRNTTWIPKLDLWMHDASCFIAVGAGHLSGEKGLIQLLRNKGYTVEPISID